MSEEKKSTFEVLSNINVSDKLDEKIGLKYLSWANAWAYLKSAYPQAFYTIYKRTVTTTEVTELKDETTGTTKTVTSTTSNEVPYFSDGKTCYVQVGVTVEGVEYVEYLPVMDNRNNAVSVSSITMTVVNKAIQRAFVKACARHGLGLYVYAGEDLPENERKAPAFVDFKKITDEVNNMKFDVTPNFDAIKNSVIDKVQNMNYDKNITDGIIGFITSVSNGKRLSLLDSADTQDNFTVQKIATFISLVENALK